METDNTNKKTEKEEKNNENYKKELDKLLTNTLNSFNNINNKYKPTQEEIDQKKDSIPEETKKRLAENNISEEQYLQFSIAREKIYQP
jgi:hypothetical protein